jgi:ribosomal protein S11
MSDKAKGKKDKKGDKKKEENKENVEAKKEEGGEEAEVKGVNLGPQDLPVGEELFGVCHICATFNDTFIHVTDLSGRVLVKPVQGAL